MRAIPLWNYDILSDVSINIFCNSVVFWGDMRLAVEVCVAFAAVVVVAAMLKASSAVKHDGDAVQCILERRTSTMPSQRFGG